MKLVTVAEMRAIEQEANLNGLAYAQMMENAGHGLAREISALVYAEGDEREALALVGPGNNGGDALVALGHLAAEGWRVRAYLVSRAPDALSERVRQASGEILLAEQDADLTRLAAFIESADVVVDGLLGTGFKAPLREDMARVMDAVNHIIAAALWTPSVVAVDCPSGVDCDSGAAAEQVIPASLTICMAAVKQGLLRFPAFELAGEIRVVDIGLTDEPSWQEVKHFAADDDLVADLLLVRPGDAHKGDFGTALIAAGSVNYTGAALLAGKAAYRVGAGLVQMAVPGALHAALAGHFPEAIWAILPSETGVIASGAADVLTKNFERATALLVGPGLGTEESTAKFIENLFTGKTATKKSSAHMGFVHAEAGAKEEKAAAGLPALVLDADGLRLLAKLENWPGLLPAESVLTPHPGEMAALTGLSKEKIQADRLGTALKFAAAWGHVVALKGAFTVIAAPDGRATVIPVATPALARAGTGDVLAGMIVGLRAQGVSAYDSAVAAAWIHAQAGLLAARRTGSEASVLAGDVVDAIGEVLGGLL
ncbi:MAG: NAD(P)H-hydrate epimerase [Anaerolineae bacterium CG_4_9_14_3_um_filter_57_17]|nr:NAD(P)H-hydrate epimerase [bacterium]NCT21595.1 NAD(P)H-hydrate epimerase [bacterium]OIO86200.1 MAG: NAD(P)H-hydrate epimerase [Anaerolineae bacterium CG2_30_57_67]PJB65428.1 MAG: NAD(P)H-hydrate epimerase [Anaerolineae bacterium CG_4_9_14_3_um_filter_57_17]